MLTKSHANKIYLLIFISLLISEKKMEPYLLSVHLLLVLMSVPII